VNTTVNELHESSWFARLRTLDAPKRVTEEDLAKLIGLLQWFDAAKLPTPSIFPGEEAGLRFEWHSTPMHLTVGLESPGKFFVTYFNFFNNEEDVLETDAEAEVRTLLETRLPAFKLG
jgi:hypothetical protein